MASEVLFERKSFSVSASTSNEAWSTEGDRAFQTEVLPANWINVGLLQTNKVI